MIAVALFYIMAMMKIVLVMLMMAVAQASGIESIRTWTNSKGKEIKAALVSWDKEGGVVNVEMKGKSRKLQYDSLSKRDQGYVKENAPLAGILTLSAKSVAWGTKRFTNWATSWGSSIKTYLSSRDVGLSMMAVSHDRKVFSAIYFTDSKGVIEARGRTDNVAKGRRLDISVRSSEYRKVVEKYVALGRTVSSGTRIKGWVVVFREDDEKGRIIKVSESVPGEKRKVNLKTASQLASPLDK